jgi:deoxyribose-phosphate aldolase
VARKKKHIPEEPTRVSISRLIDYTYLKPHSPADEFREFIRKAVEFPFACVIIPPCTVAATVEYFRARRLKTRVGTVVSFPLGFDPLPSKVTGILIAGQGGASEVDVVANVALLRSHAGEYEHEIGELVSFAHRGSLLIKIILETAVLTPGEVVLASRIVSKCGADFIKTSTGSFGNPTPDTVRRIREATRSKTPVKASGGIRALAEALAFVEAGATRIGTSSGYEIVMECSR